MITALEAKELLDNGILPVVIMPSQNNYYGNSASIIDNNTKGGFAAGSSSSYNIICITGYFMADENTISQFGTNQGKDCIFYVNQAGELTIFSSFNGGGEWN